MRAWTVLALGALIAVTASDVGCRRAPPARWTTAVFPTEGMTCGGCEQAIQTAVGKLDGVTAVKASHVEKRTQVTYDASRLRPEQIARVIDKLGYRARLPAP